MQLPVEVQELTTCNILCAADTEEEGCHLGAGQKAAGKCSIYTKLLPAVVYGQSSPTHRLSANPPWYGARLRSAYFLQGGGGELQIVTDLEDISVAESRKLSNSH